MKSIRKSRRIKKSKGRKFYRKRYSRKKRGGNGDLQAVNPTDSCMMGLIKNLASRTDLKEGEFEGMQKLIVNKCKTPYAFTSIDDVIKAYRSQHRTL